MSDAGSRRCIEPVISEAVSTSTEASSGSIFLLLQRPMNLPISGFLQRHIGCGDGPHWQVMCIARAPRSKAFAATIWHPLYAYVRRRGHSPEDAQDLTQQFFAQLLIRNSVATVAPEKGRFRSFLLASMNHFLADEWDKARAQKRGGGNVISLDLQNAETIGRTIGAKFHTIKAFERRWATALLEQVYRRLEETGQGKGELFNALRRPWPGKAIRALRGTGQLGHERRRG